MLRAFAFVAIVSLAGPARADAPPAVIDASVRVDVPQGGGRTAHGSGTVVALCPDAIGQTACIVLTNRHVCPTGTCPIIVYWPHKSYAAAAVWLGADDKADLAAVWCRAPDGATCCEPADDAPTVGEPLHQVGYPHTRGPVQRRGPALAWDGARCLSGAAVFCAGIATEQGDSGSGIFNARGRLVAIVWGGGDGRAHAVGLHDVRRFLIIRLRLGRLFPRLAP